MSEGHEWEEPNGHAEGATGNAPSAAAQADDEPSADGVHPRLTELAEVIAVDETSFVTSKVEHVRLQGKRLAEAWKLCEDPDCGLKGHTVKARFGRWRESAKFAGCLPQTTARNYRRLYEAFGHLPTEVIERIGISNCYRLGSEDADEWVREEVIERARNGERFSGSSVKKKLRAEHAFRQSDEERRKELAEQALHAISKAAQSLPDDASRLTAIRRMGIAPADLLAEAVRKFEPAEVAKAIAHTLRQTGLWDLVQEADPGRVDAAVTEESS